MPPQLHFGRILPNYLYRTSDGEFFLSSSTAGTAAADALGHPYPEARERAGQFAAIRATVQEGVMLGCSLVEAVPPIASSVFARLVDTHKDVRGRVLGIAREVRDELVGESGPVPPRAIPVEIRPSGPLPLCVIDIGHHPSAPGADGVLRGKTVTEFDFNRPLAEMIAAKVTQARIHIIHRDSGDNAGRKGLPAKTNALNPNFVISLHANSSDPMSHGSEVLYYHNSPEGKKLASLLQRRFLEHLGLRDRKTKPIKSAERGGDQLAMTKAVIVIGEPFFIGNPGEFAHAAAHQEALATAYAGAIDAYAESLCNPAPDAIAGRVVASDIEPGTTFCFDTGNLTKEQFFQRNRASLEALIGSLNARLGFVYGPGFSRLTREDVWVITYIEAGLRRGLVDPDHRHSEGERGLLPLASNIRSWNGPDAPEWNCPMPVARNLEHFYLYLGHLKNKSVTGGPRHLYRNLFRLDGIAGNPVRGAKLLAGVVHGYFYSGNYRDRKIPSSHLIQGYRQDVPLADLMRPTRYVHAGTSIITGRAANIETALGLV